MPMLELMPSGGIAPMIGSVTLDWLIAPTPSLEPLPNQPLAIGWLIQRTKSAVGNWLAYPAHQISRWQLVGLSSAPNQPLAIGWLIQRTKSAVGNWLAYPAHQISRWQLVGLSSAPNQPLASPIIGGDGD
ncbi:hypothetical protein [Moraxella sp. FZLJ2109]|uniref:hypothetical protein n=1 Tax=Moraxella sp. FZLJ2109 TaxID=2961890 RepID=UPI0020C91D39|nr:hypothetical protein [Moraxella sp. FZLJ2109]UTO21584.1 hypothetical protein NKU06_06965 [Moraxella sp. FZLJ2109]